MMGIGKLQFDREGKGRKGKMATVKEMILDAIARGVERSRVVAAAAHCVAAAWDLAIEALPARALDEPDVPCPQHLGDPLAWVYDALRCLNVGRGTPSAGPLATHPRMVAIRDWMAQDPPSRPFGRMGHIILSAHRGARYPADTAIGEAAFAVAQACYAASAAYDVRAAVDAARWASDAAFAVAWTQSYRKSERRSLYMNSDRSIWYWVYWHDGDAAHALGRVARAAYEDSCAPVVRSILLLS